MEGVAPGAGPHGQPLRAGGWGPGRPSFWCVGVETQRATVAVFLVREEDAARFRDAGYTFFSLSNEGSILNAALKGFVEGTRKSLGQ